MDYSLNEFLALAIGMEEEAAERYLELADMMEAHDNQKVSKLFRDMNRYSCLHRDSIKERAGSIELPHLKSWQYRWTNLPSEVGGEEGFDYSITPYDALEYARENEVRAMQFYKSVADSSSDAEIKKMATEFAEEEEEHTQMLDDLLANTKKRH